MSHILCHRFDTYVFEPLCWVCRVKLLVYKFFGVIGDNPSGVGPAPGLVAGILTYSTGGAIIPSELTSIHWWSIKVVLSITLQKTGD